MDLERLEKDHYYHIFNRGINSDSIFKTEDNKTYFLNLIEKHLDKKVHVLAYCLMNNHFHLIIKIIEDEAVATQALSNLFNAYAKAFNKQQNRTGSLFEKHFKRKKITDENYLKNLILYIHKNPENHKVINNFKDYKFTSYNLYFSDDKSLISNTEQYVINLFGDLYNFERTHQTDLQGFKNLAGPENIDAISTNPQGVRPNLQGLQDLVGFKNLVGAENVETISTNPQDVSPNLQGLQDLVDFKNLAGAENINTISTNPQDVSPNQQGLQDLVGFKNLADPENIDTISTNPQDVSPNLQGLQDLVGFKDPVDSNKKPPMKNKFFTYIQNLQDQICKGLETADGQAKFREDLWDRPEGGGGRTRVIENGNVFEKGGVNISGVHGKLPKSMQTYFKVGDVDFFACGLSLVLHPKNPMVPTVHANWRYFEMYDQNKNIIDSWFGGGQDLTPYYLFEEDAVHFHQTCKTACDQHNDAFYKKYKKQCDEYFYNAHREEGRGIGGLFFDYCKATDNMTMENWYSFVTEVGNSFLEAYVPIVEKRKNLSFSEAQKKWQEIRRGRYVEFNLVHDKGTLFGLKTNGRIESILMSLPPHVQWVYDHKPEAGSEEEKLLEVLKNPKDWVKSSVGATYL